MTNGSLMKVESIAEWTPLSDNWSWKPIFGLFESGCFTRVLHRFYMGFTVNAGLDEDYKSDREEIKTDTESSHSEEEDDQVFDKLEHARPEETPYSENKIEELGQVWLDSWRLRPKWKKNTCLG